MEKQKPERYFEIHDPKLPVIRGQSPCNRAEAHQNPCPLPQSQAEL